jgi:cytochrome c peroxidase
MSDVRPAVISAVATLTLLVFATAGTRSQALISALPTHADAPADNPTTPEKVALGRLLFWDPILSGAKDVACATCHHPATGYADGRDLPIGTSGIGLGPARHFADGASAHFVKRNSPTVLNTAFNGLVLAGPRAVTDAPMFWDNRVRSLEAQALEPIKAEDEMRGGSATAGDALVNAVARVAAIKDYRTQFTHAFGSRDAVTADNIGRAIAAFERTLVTTNSPFDRYMRGDTSAMTATQIRGMTRFQTMGCTGCHSGPMFSDYEVHTLGVQENAKLAAPDTGQGDTYAFRTPSLRNLAYTAPYMHNGTLATLDDVINFYNRVGGRGRGGPGGRQGRPGGPGGPGGPPGNGGATFAQGPGQGRPGGGPGGAGGRGRGGTPNPNVRRQDLDPLLLQVNVRGGREDVVAFLLALSDDSFDHTIPDRVPSGLRPGGKTR